MGDLGKKGWSSLGGSNIASPQGGYNSTSDNFDGFDGFDNGNDEAAGGYQRSTSGNKAASPTGVGMGRDDWNWNEESKHNYVFSS